MSITKGNILGFNTSFDSETNLLSIESETNSVDEWLYGPDGDSGNCMLEEVFGDDKHFDKIWFAVNALFGD